MKKVEAIIRPEKLNAVKAALEEINYPGMTLTDVRGHGKQKGLTRQWRGREYKVEFMPKLKIEIVAVDKDVPHVIDAITLHGRTGEVGDGKIFVIPVDDCIQVRTGTKGNNAI